jgi:hypothetical protein
MVLRDARDPLLRRSEHLAVNSSMGEHLFFRERQFHDFLGFQTHSCSMKKAAGDIYFDEVRLVRPALLLKIGLGHGVKQ